jgi:hypothetical protein
LARGLSAALFGPVALSIDGWVHVIPDSVGQLDHRRGDRRKPARS